MLAYLPSQASFRANSKSHTKPFWDDSFGSEWTGEWTDWLGWFLSEKSHHFVKRLWLSQSWPSPRHFTASLPRLICELAGLVLFVAPDLLAFAWQQFPCHFTASLPRLICELAGLALFVTPDLWAFSHHSFFVTPLLHCWDSFVMVEVIVPTCNTTWPKKCLPDKAAIAMINKNQPTTCAHHIEIQHFAIQKWRAKKEIVMRHIPVIINLSDDLTKALGWILYSRHARRGVGLYRIGSPQDSELHVCPSMLELELSWVGECIKTIPWPCSGHG